jgi:GTPase SAR1 family protein
MSRYKSSNNSIKSHLSTVSLPKEEVNIVLLGKQNVGKSALVVKYLTKRFIREYDPFLGKNKFLVYNIKTHIVFFYL